MGVFDDFKKNITTAFANLPLTADLAVGAVFSILSGKTLDEVIKQEDKTQLAQMDIESMLGGAPSGKGMFSPLAEHSSRPEWDAENEVFTILDDFGNRVPMPEMPEPVSFPMDPSIGADEYLLEEMLGFEGQGGLAERLNLMAGAEGAPPTTLEELANTDAPLDRDAIAQILYANTSVYGSAVTYNELMDRDKGAVDDARADMLQQGVVGGMGSALGNIGSALGNIGSAVASPFKKYLEMSGISGPSVPMVAPSGPAIGAADALTEEMMGFEDPVSLIQNPELGSLNVGSDIGDILGLVLAKNREDGLGTGIDYPVETSDSRLVQLLKSIKSDVAPTSFPMDPSLGRDEALMEEMLGFEDPSGVATRMGGVDKDPVGTILDPVKAALGQLYWKNRVDQDPSIEIDDLVRVGGKDSDYYTPPLTDQYGRLSGGYEMGEEEIPWESRTGAANKYDDWSYQSRADKTPDPKMRAAQDAMAILIGLNEEPDAVILQQIAELVAEGVLTRYDVRDWLNSGAFGGTRTDAEKEALRKEINPITPSNPVSRYFNRMVDDWSVRNVAPYDPDDPSTWPTPGHAEDWSEDYIKPLRDEEKKSTIVKIYDEKKAEIEAKEKKAAETTTTTDPATAVSGTGTGTGATATTTDTGTGATAATDTGTGATATTTTATGTGDVGVSGVNADGTPKSTAELAEEVMNSAALAQINAEELTIPNTTARVFYDTMFQLQGAGSPDVRARLPQLLADTRALFELYNPDLAKNRAYIDDLSGDPIPSEAWESAQDRYGKFLGDYLKNPSQYRGQDFQDKITYLNKWLQAGQEGSMYRLDAEGKSTVPEGDLQTHAWAQNIMNNQDTLRGLAKIYRTGGRNDYYSQRIHSFIDDMAKYWSMQGMSEADIFRRLTASTGQQAPLQDDTEKILAAGATNVAELDDTTYVIPPSKDYNRPRAVARQDEFLGGKGSMPSGRSTPGDGPAAFNVEEEAKKQQGLPYSMKAYRNGKVVRGSTWGG